MDVLRPQARAFVAVVQHGSVTSAAEQLGVSKSTVSQALKDMEENFGIRLLNRTTRQQSLTPIGERLYHRCCEILRSATALESDVHEYLAEPSGKFTIAAPQIAITAKIASTLSILCGKYPQLRPNLILEEKQSDLVEHKIDVAIRLGQLCDSELKAIKLGDIREIYCASPELLAGHGLTRRDAGCAESVAKLPFIANSWQSSRIELFRGIEISPTIVCSCSVAAYECTLRGAGFSRLPEAMADKAIADGRLCQLLPGSFELVSPLYALHPFGNLPPLAVRSFVEGLRSALKSST
ncbi:LysR family transcriptional regulator [Roseovarius sp. EL26]|uniref:LysR family transcriptional regulator n=1 Tax=Roseovarius sp. EL26 TaxID=2126672 RepID=UPI0013C43ED2|nr:LysR family transcriptional regulator [Roseovarius sp. EL26]